jgi:hypothetical protein
MRNKTAKMLRRVAARRYREMLVEEKVNKPTSFEHMVHQQRVVYRALKEAWKKSSRPDRERASKSWRESLGR